MMFTAFALAIAATVPTTPVAAASNDGQTIVVTATSLADSERCD